ncbi:MAG: bifunctional (p)ppGpp synthetase/guanosine-3',5'-bis(diphosphate) 3'-pyrophosphohydrolase [Erysipelotrichaceae bacterium]|nr:bifunctional (p)ppGpp synthetase/guanosine-3',5'-bis(diphosphate) 3'-pyrophosphohydrolase [Erysipelotrichaceae bacterium]
MEKPREITKEIFYDAIGQYITKSDSLALIEKAYYFAFECHRQQKRETGEPYFVHVLNVAYSLALLHCGPQTIAAGFLHDTMEDCGVKKEEIEQEFDPDIAMLVDSVTKIGKLQFKDLNEYQATNHRKIMIAMAKDIRVIIIKLVDRLHNMRTLDVCSEEKQKRVSQETLDVYVPIADRLGFGEMKNEMEDLCLYYLHHDAYMSLKRLVDEKSIESEKVVNNMIEDISALLKEHGFEFEIHGRRKHFNSIFNKMVNKDKTFEEIYDLYGIRIIVKTELNCYEVLGYIHAKYRPMAGRLKDYIAMPKFNMYQSIHTTIFDDEGNIFEIQIRTYEMDEVAEVGVAAHWSYKEGVQYSSAKEQQEIENKLSWYHDFVTMMDENDLEHPTEVMNMLKKDIFEASIYVMSPKGRVIELPNGATPIDFAYRIHTEVGQNAIGAVVNGVLVPLNTELQTGDVVNIKTSKQPTEPSEDWLKFVKTATARNKIKAYFVKKETEERQAQIEKGEKILIDELRRRGYNEKDYLEKGKIEQACKALMLNNYDELRYAIANKSVSMQQVIEKITSIKQSTLMDNDTLTTMLQQRRSNAAQRVSSAGVIVEGIDNIKVSLAGCCLPVYGDEIVGYISKGSGVKVHRADCPNVNKEGSRLIGVSWDISASSKQFETWLRIDATDRNYLISDIVTCLSLHKATLTGINSEILPDKVNCFVMLKIRVANDETLRQLMANLRKLSNVTAVNRIIR